MTRIVLIGAGSVEFTRLVSLVPMVALFVIAQQYFVRGIAISGLKG